MKTRGPTPCPQGWGRPPRAPPYLLGPLDALRRQLQLYIFAFGEKKIRENNSFTTRNMSTCDHHYWSLKGHGFSFATFL